MLTENKFNKYLLYAIGEIVLVVIGILIALQINNWNEEVKKEERISSVFETIKKDLISDIKEADRFIQYYNAKDSIVELVHFYKKGGFYSRNNPDFRTVVMFYNTLSINKLGYETLKQNIYAVPLKYEKALIDINFIYTEILENIEVNNKSNRLLLERTLQKWADNYSWYRTSMETASAPNDAMIDFFLNDNSYLGDVRMVKMLGIDNHLLQAQLFKINAISALIKLDQINNIPFEESVKDLKIKIGSVKLIKMQPIQEYEFKTAVADYQAIPVIINNSFNKKLFFYYRDEEGLDVLIPIEQNRIEPKTIASFYLLKDFPFIIKDALGAIIGTFRPTSSYNCINLR